MTVVIQGHTNSKQQNQNSKGRGGAVVLKGCFTWSYSLCIWKDTLDLLRFPKKYTRTWG